MRFTLWDVQHGVSIWVTTPKGHHHWFDLGKTLDFSPSQYVAKEYGVQSIDYLTISHPDKDHIEDLLNFTQVFSPAPRALLRNKSLPPSEFLGSGKSDYQKIMDKLHRTYIHDIHENESPKNPNYNGGIEYKQCYLSHGAFLDDTKLEGNNTSIVTFMLYKKILFVYPGDIESKGWSQLWNDNGGDLQNFITRAKTRLLVAPHHGRESGYSKEMMDSIQPHIVFISDKWGESETHRSYYERPIGIMLNGQIIKYLSTKTNRRILCEVDESGSLRLNQFENKKITQQTISPSELSI